jgi:hypothetical protein
MLKMMKEMRRKARLKINGECQELAFTTENNICCEVSFCPFSTKA